MYIDGKINNFHLCPTSEVLWRTWPNPVSSETGCGVIVIKKKKNLNVQSNETTWVSDGSEHIY